MNFSKCSTYIELNPRVNFAGLGLSAQKLSSILIVQQYFDKKRASMTAFSLIGSSLAAVTWTPIFAAVVGLLGWRYAVAIQASLTLQSTVLGATYRPPPRTRCLPIERNPASEDKTLAEGSPSGFDSSKTDEHPSTEFERRSKPPLRKNVQFILYTAGDVMVMYGMYNMYQQSPSRAVFNGLSKTQASFLPPAIGMASTLSRLVASLVAWRSSHLISCATPDSRLLAFGVAALFGGFVECLSSVGKGFVAAVTFCVAYGFCLGM